MSRRAPVSEETTKQIEPETVLAAPPPPLWLAVHREGRTDAYPLPRGTPLTLGRTDAADVVVPDESLSRVHVCFTGVGDEVRVEDRGSTNGTFVGGRRVRSTVIKAGDEVVIGKVTVSIHARSVHADPAPRPPGAPQAPQTIVASAKLRDLYESLDQVALTRAPVLILGETGVGKELVARAIHDRSPRAGKPFESINCAALTPSLVESRLFGHEQGAFTGAAQSKRGLFELAAYGSLFLDEVAELPLEVQAALLRVLDTQKIRAIGAAAEVSVDVRVIAATNRDLEQMCNDGKFRKDLFFRLNTIVLHVPPLRERIEEIRPLAERFLTDAVREAKLAPRRLGTEALRALEAHHWPGNVRELRNVIERAALFARADEIGPGDLLFAAIAPAAVASSGIASAATATGPVAPVAPPRAPAADAGHDEGDLRERVRAYEIDLIVRALERTGWKQAAAAKLLKLPVRTLAHKVQLYGISRDAPQRR